MNRLHTELHRLYLPHTAAASGVVDAATGLIDPQGAVRAMVLELARPADWEVLAKVWRGVQADLELPAPAIAVSGADGLQLWFSLAQAIPAAQASAFLASLVTRYLPDIAPKRWRQWPALDASAPGQARHAALVPAEQAQTGNWSAFVAPDLAPVFADTPWLDIPPSADGQADLLCRLRSIEPSALEAALELLRPAVPLTNAASPAPVAVDAAFKLAHPAAPVEPLDPRRFLLQVMNDDNVPLALRIEAAKALLPYGEEPRRRQD